MVNKNKKTGFFKQFFQLVLLVFLVAIVSGGLRLIENFLREEKVAAVQSDFSVREEISKGYIGRDNYPRSIINEPEVLGMSFTATEKPHWQAKKVNQLSPTIKISPGKSLTFWVDFKNTGTVTWQKNSEHFVALNVDGKNNSHNPFRHNFWPADYRPCLLSNQEVAPLETGRFIFALTAPEQPGTYQAEFGLVAENLTWIEGGKLQIKITVLEPPPAYQAELVNQSFSEIQIAPDTSFTFEAKFKNTGSATWHNSGANFIALNVTGPTGRTSQFIHDYWPYYYRPGVMQTGTVAPGETGTFRFALQGPDIAGFYLEEFNLVAENLTFIDGGFLSLPITVKQPTLPASTVEAEQNIRVGLFSSEEEFVVTANKRFQVTNTNDKNIADLAAGQIVTVEYLQNQYQIQLPDDTYYSDYPVVFSSEKAETIFEIVNYQNATAWNSQLNDNRFRNKLEINQAAATGRTWIINELPLELYLRGVAEASNDCPGEYLKALIIAERTYAQYHLLTGTKHADENFTVDASNDQVYRGYGFEERAHPIVELVETTKGQMVTYDGEVVVTPYFSRTDGRTRAWEEVWSGGPKPWLQSVDDPACSDMEMLGHGVGMSAYGARAMAEDEASYDEILKYYYTGIEIDDFY